MLLLFIFIVDEIISIWYDLNKTHALSSLTWNGKHIFSVVNCIVDHYCHFSYQTKIQSISN